MNTAEYLLERADEQQVALVTDSAQFTYQDLRDAVSRVTGALARAGVEPADRVGLLARNSLYWVAAYVGILRLGAVAVPLATTATATDLAAQMETSGAGTLCVERGLARRLTGGMKPSIRQILDDVLNQPELAGPPNGLFRGDDSADAALMFTSGTTGRPRAVRVTHRNIQANTDSIIDYLGLSCAERIMVVLPFFYCFGTSLLHTHLRVGGTLVLSNTFTFPETTLALMETHGCTGFAGVPSVFQTLLRNSTFRQRTWPHLRKVQQAGGRLPPVLVQELAAALPEADVYIMYGQTEATARLSYLPPELLTAKLGSIGRGIPGVELRVIDDSGVEVRPGQVGEIVARGDSICPGYWNDPEATEAKFAAGVLHTGDLATVDENGWIYVVDRKSDFIKSFGYRVSSQQVEACLQELPEVVNAAVVGAPDMARGEAIIAFVKLHTGAMLTAEQIIAHCAQRLARHMIPAAVFIIDYLPMNTQGKVVKTELRRQALTLTAVAEAADTWARRP